MVDLVGDIKKKIGLGASGGGTDHFVRQRFTGLINIPASVAGLLILAKIWKHPDQAIETIAQPFIAIILAVFFFSVAYHMKLGLQVVIEDYIHNSVVKFLALALNYIYCLGISIIFIFTIFFVIVGVI